MSLFGEYKNSLKMPEVEEILDLIFYRPIAFVLVKAIYSTNITPNQLTVASILVSIASAIFYAIGTPLYVVIGAWLFLVHLVFDCMDGQLARMKKNGTAAGRIIDGVGDFVSTVVVFIGLAIGYQIVDYDPLIWWLLVVLTMLSNGIQSVLVDYYRNRFLDYVLQRKSTFTEELDSFKAEFNRIKDDKSKWLERLTIDLYLRYSALQANMIGNKEVQKAFIATPDEYYKANKLVMRLWLYIGPTTQVSALIFCTFINRFDIFFWLMIVVFSVIALVMWLVQKAIDKKFNKPSIQ
jgi:phosphatidylglycerophosphate synthase